MKLQGWLLSKGSEFKVRNSKQMNEGNAGLTNCSCRSVKAIGSDGAAYIEGRDVSIEVKEFRTSSDILACY